MTHKYKDWDDLKESGFDLTLTIWSEKKRITTAQVNDFMWTFVVNLRGMKTENQLFLTITPEWKQE